MAKKKKSTGTRRRRRVGAAGGSQMNVLLGAAIGAVGGQFLKKQVEKMDTGGKIKPAMIGGGQLLAGWFLSKQNNPMMKGIGMGMIGAGAINLAQSAGIGRVGAPVVEFRKRVSGYQDVSNIAAPGINGPGAYSNLSNLAGSGAF